MKTSTVVTITGITLASAVVGYAAYFDYRRRHDATFRRSLGKQYKRQKKAEAKKADEHKKASETAIAAAVASTRAALADGTIPKDPATRESYFMEQISIGELLFNRGEEFHLDSATAFFRALKVYPQPFELLIILGKTVPAEVNALIMKMVETDVLLSEGDSSNPLANVAGAGAGVGVGAGSSINVNEVDDEAPSSSSQAKKEEEPKQEDHDSETKQDGKKEEEEAKDVPKTESLSGSTNEWDVVSATSDKPTQEDNKPTEDKSSEEDKPEEDKPTEETSISTEFGAAAEPAADAAPIHFTFGSNDTVATEETNKSTEEQGSQQEQQDTTTPAAEPEQSESTTLEPTATSTDTVPSTEEVEQKTEQEPKDQTKEEPSSEDPEEVAP